MTGPSFGRAGENLGETSRSLAERCAEHYNDAESFSKKAHMIKHWTSSHEELNTPLPFTFKIKKQYTDCLFRQVGEAISILLSKHQLLQERVYSELHFKNFYPRRQLKRKMKILQGRKKLKREKKKLI